MNAFPPANAQTARLFARLEGCTCENARVVVREAAGRRVAVVFHRDGCPLDPGAGRLSPGGFHPVSRP